MNVEIPLANNDDGPITSGLLNLAESNAKLQAILDSAVDAIVTIDEKRTVLSFNPAAQRMFGYRAEEVVGRNVTILMPSPYHEEHDQYLESYLSTGERRIIGIGREVSGRRKDGATFPIDLAVAEARVADWRIFVGTIRDLSERKRAEKLEKQLLRAQRLESIGMLAGGIAHDLNNVLTPILMTGKLLRRVMAEEQRHELLATLQSSAERGAEMVRQLLMFAGGIEGERTNLQMQNMLREVVSLLEHTLPKSIAIDVQINDDLWEIKGDSTQLSQVIMNLCVNARDAMPDGGFLKLSAKNVVLDQQYASQNIESASGPYLKIAVTDSGSGIAPELIDRIFDPFFTTKQLGKGTGLGLSTALGIVKAHGGFLNAYSEIGRGTRFTVYLPAAESAAAAAETQNRRWRATAGVGRTILVVDDEPSILMTAKFCLEEYGFRALTAANGDDGVRIFAANRANIAGVVLDMMMPGMDGLAVIAAIRGLDAEAPIVAASGLWVGGRTDEAMNAGASAFLQKPFSDEQLLEALALVLKLPQ